VINLDLLDLPQINLSELLERFIEEEVHRVICSLPPDKAPGLDGFTARSPGSMGNDQTRGHASIRCLLAHGEIRDYRPISLIHVLGKLFSEVLPNRLAPRLGELIHITQSTFVKGRYIQDNLRYVQSVTKTAC
jgi:hypothetical protein